MHNTFHLCLTIIYLSPLNSVNSVLKLVLHISAKNDLMCMFLGCWWKPAYP